MVQTSRTARPRKTAVASAVPSVEMPIASERQCRPRKSALTSPAVQALGSLRARQAADFYGIGLSTFWRKTLLEGFPKPIKIGTRITLWKIEDLIAWRDAQQHRATK